MSTTKASILALANFLCANLGDTTEMDRLYYEVELELAHDARLWNPTVLVTTATETQFTFSGLQLHGVFYDGRQLLEASQASLDAVSPAWRDEIGTPVAYVRAFHDNHIFRLYPRTSDVTRSVQLICTLTTDTDVPSILELPMALFIIAREFSRESNHRDLPFAEMANAMANQILEMVG